MVMNVSRTPAEEGRSRVIYIGHLPHGFFERQLREYFGQFGKVMRVRVSRSKRTANSRGYGYVQFQHSEVAAIAAEAMNGYLMLGQKLCVHTVEADAQHAELWKGAGRAMRKKPWAKLEAERFNKERTRAQHEARVRKLVRRDSGRAARIRELGIDYEYKTLEVPSKPEKKVF